MNFSAFSPIVGGNELKYTQIKGTAQHSRQPCTRHALICLQLVVLSRSTNRLGCTRAAQMMGRGWRGQQGGMERQAKRRVQVPGDVPGTPAPRRPTKGCFQPAGCPSIPSGEVMWKPYQYGATSTSTSFHLEEVKDTLRAGGNLRVRWGGRGSAASLCRGSCVSGHAAAGAAGQRRAAGSCRSPSCTAGGCAAGSSRLVLALSSSSSMESLKPSAPQGPCR